MTDRREPLFPTPTDADFWGAVVISTGTVGLIVAIGSIISPAPFTWAGALQIGGTWLLTLGAIYARMVLGRYLLRRKRKPDV